MHDFNLPRKISLGSKLHLFFFHKTISIVGLIFLIISVMIIFFFYPYIDFSQFYLNENSPKSKGIITDIIPTSIKEGTVRIYKYKFYYQPTHSPINFTLSSYGKNNTLLSKSGISTSRQPGDTVTVIYSDEHPEVAKIEGMDYKPAPFFILILMMIPLLIGLILLLSQIPNYKKTLRLIREGVIGEAIFISMTSTNIKINDKRVMKLLFRFKTITGEYEFTYKTNHPEAFRTSGIKHPILYDPENPNCAILVQALPRKIRDSIL